MQTDGKGFSLNSSNKYLIPKISIVSKNTLVTQYLKTDEKCISKIHKLFPT